VIVGAGLAGLEAAATAPGPVLILDENSAPGGLRLQALEELAAAPGARLERFPGLDNARARLVQARNALDRPDVTLWSGARVVAGFAPCGLVVRRGDTLSTVHGEHVVWAAGALDVLGLFPGNDTAGALGPRAVLRLLLRDRLDVTARHALLVGGGLDFWLCANLLEARGARVTLVVTGSGMHSEISAAVDRRWPLHTGLDLMGLRGLDETTLRAEFTPGRRQPGPADSHLRLDADFVVVCGRGKPTYDIPYQLGADLDLDPARGGFVARSAAEGCRLTVAGEAAGLSPETLLTTALEVE